MLILSRSPGEGIFIGDDIKVSVRRVKGLQVSIAIEAPKSINIRRDELENRPPLPAVSGNRR